MRSLILVLALIATGCAPEKKDAALAASPTDPWAFTAQDLYACNHTTFTNAHFNGNGLDLQFYYDCVGYSSTCGGKFYFKSPRNQETGDYELQIKYESYNGAPGCPQTGSPYAKFAKVTVMGAYPRQFYSDMRSNNAGIVNIYEVP